MNVKHISLIVFVLPTALLLGALGFQYIVGLAPCELCIDQRWPHLAGALFGLIALALANGASGWAKIAALFGAIGIAASGVIAVFHSGVERKWWAGPSSCSSALSPNLSIEEYIKQIEEAAVVSCGDITWSLFGLSMANYNALISLVSAGLIAWLVIKAPTRA